MTCIHCKGQMRTGTAPFQVNRNGYHLVLDSVPAWVCSQCGEPYFDEHAVQAIQDMIRAVDERTKSLAVPAGG